MTVYYAIGDIHGEDQKLARMHEFILDDAARHGGDFLIMHLGDLIDRGPDSRGVVARVMAMEAEGKVRCAAIMGNHEALMLHAFDKVETIGLMHWAMNGGDETIQSYVAVNGDAGIWKDAIDREHIAWLRTLPSIWRDEERRIAFVHGGIDPATFPECKDEVRLWTRSSKFFKSARWPRRSELEGLLVVHGHTPTDDYRPDIEERRINVDTGACFGGPLTCVVLAPDEKPRFLYAGYN